MLLLSEGALQRDDAKIVPQISIVAKFDADIAVADEAKDGFVVPQGDPRRCLEDILSRGEIESMLRNLVSFFCRDRLEARDIVWPHLADDSHIA